MIRVTNGGNKIELNPESKTAKKLMDAMFEDTKIKKIRFSARHEAGTLFCEFVKNVDYKKRPKGTK